MPFYCYLLECADGTYYTGWTTDPERRLHQHNTGRGSRYTRSRLPVRIVYLEPQADRSAALKREAEIKRLSHRQKEALASQRVSESANQRVNESASQRIGEATR